MKSNIKIVFMVLFLSGLLFAGEQKRTSAVFVVSCYFDDQAIHFESVWESMPATKIPQGYRVSWEVERLSYEPAEAKQGKMVTVPDDSTFKTFEQGKDFFLLKVSEKLDSFKQSLPIKK